MSVESIAHGLATEFRYGGHTDPLVNVAQHSVDTAKLLEEQGYGAEIQFYGLHHDSEEAYLGDVQKPNKEVLNSLDELEDVWQEAIWSFLEVGFPNTIHESAVKEMDYILYLFESEELFENGEHSYEAGQRVDVDNIQAQVDLTDVGRAVDLDQAYQDSKDEFLEMHEDLRKRI